MNTVAMNEVVTVNRDCNTFTFFTHVMKNKLVVVVRQFTDFTGSELADDFPNGSTMHWNCPFPATISITDAVNAAGRKLLKEWVNI